MRDKIHIYDDTSVKERLVVEDCFIARDGNGCGGERLNIHLERFSGEGQYWKTEASLIGLSLKQFIDLARVVSRMYARNYIVRYDDGGEHPFTYVPFTIETHDYDECFERALQSPPGVAVPDPPTE